MKQFGFIDGTKKRQIDSLSHAMKGKNVGRTHNRLRLRLNRRSQSVTTTVVGSGIDVGRDEGYGEEEMDSSTLSVVCDLLPPLPGPTEATTLKGSLDGIENCTYFPKE